MDSHKPVRVSLQKATEITCTMCTVNNYLGTKEWTDFVAWKSHVTGLWINGPGARFTKKPEVQMKMLKEISGPYGVSQDLLALYFKDMNMPVRFVKDPTKIFHGILGLDCIIGSLRFGHSVCVVNGYVIDSIINIDNFNGVYKWKGKIYGYTAATVTMGREFY